MSTRQRDVLIPFFEVLGTELSAACGHSGRWGVMCMTCKGRCDGGRCWETE